MASRHTNFLNFNIKYLALLLMDWILNFYVIKPKKNILTETGENMSKRFFYVFPAVLKAGQPYQMTGKFSGT